MLQYYIVTVCLLCYYEHLTMYYVMKGDNKTVLYGTKFSPYLMRSNLAQRAPLFFVTLILLLLMKVHVL